MPTTLSIAVFYIAGIFCLTVTFIIAWLNNFREANQFMPTGLALMLVMLFMDVVALYVVGTEAIGARPWFFILMLATTAARIYACTVVGMLLADRLRVSQLARVNTYGVSAPSREALAYAALTTVLMVLYSAVLFRLSDVSISANFQSDAAQPFEVSSLGILVVAAMGFSEEIIFRLGLQTGLAYLWRLSRFGQHWAILITTVLWCAGHVGTLDPEWVKIAQIFVFGISLGYLNKRFGVVPCIITHMLFNVVMAMLAPTLFDYDALVR